MGSYYKLQYNSGYTSLLTLRTYVLYLKINSNFLMILRLKQ